RNQISRPIPRRLSLLENLQPRSLGPEVHLPRLALARGGGDFRHAVSRAHRTLEGLLQRLPLVPENRLRVGENYGHPEIGPPQLLRFQGQLVKRGGVAEQV